MNRERLHEAAIDAGSASLSLAYAAGRNESGNPSPGFEEYALEKLEACAAALGYKLVKADAPATGAA